MTGNEIIKALECCIKAKTNADCETLKCPFYDNQIDICMYVNNEEVIYANALDLINRQQETIETLRNCVEQHHIIRKDGKSPLSLLTAEIKAEAIKEFADKLKEKYKYHELCGYEVINGELDDLVKEMVGEE